MSFRDKFEAAMRKARKLPKATATLLLNEAQDTLKARNAEAEEKLREQINLVAPKGKIHPLRAYPQALNDNSPAVQNHALKTNAALTLYPNERTTVLIKQFLTASHNKLIEETLMPDGCTRLDVWNEKTRSRDIFEEIYTESSSDGAPCGQFTSYYDKANRCLSINLAGTVFTDVDDLQSATQILIESATSLRMTRVKKCIDEMVSSFNKHYPGELAKTQIDIYAHSAGATAVPLTNYFLQRGYGVVPRAQIMIDPFGAKNSFEKIAQMIAQAEGRSSQKVLAELSQNILTFRPEQNSFIGSLKNLKIFNPTLGNSPETIGRIKMADIGGNAFSRHQIRSWVKHFSNEELRESQNPPFKKPSGPQA